MYITFDHIIETYHCDKKLRSLFSEYIERIEVSMRAMLTDNYLLSYGFFWYVDKSRFDPPTPINPEYKSQLEVEGRKIPRKYLDTHQYILDCIDDSFKTATEQFIIKFKRNYPGDEFPPSNMAMEILSMGKIAQLFGALKSCKERDVISNVYQTSHVVLVSWLTFLTNVRNICAHHGRLWNSRLTADQFAIPARKSNRFNGELPDNFNTTIYGTLSVMMRLLAATNPNNNLLSNFEKLVGEYPNINLALMGFPENWKEDPAWLKSKKL